MTLCRIECLGIDVIGDRKQLNGSALDDESLLPMFVIRVRATAIEFDEPVPNRFRVAGPPCKGSPVL